jgi:hypothetical protein
MVLAAWLITGCGESPSSQTPSPPPIDRVQLPAQKPDYAFAEGVGDKNPEVVAFMRHFMETCLAGDYSGYRRLVARSSEPESRARFERVLNALKRLTVISIEPVESKKLPTGTYLVIADVELAPDERRASPDPRQRRRKVGILVLKEEGDFRLMFAPRALQPIDHSPEPNSQPTTTTAPSYPWDEDTDY